MYRANASSLPESRPFRDAQSQICNLTQDFATAFNTGNYDQAAAMFAHDGVLMVPGHESAYGQKAIERLLIQIGGTEYCGLRLETTRVEHSGDMAMEIGQCWVAARNADGMIAPERGKYVKVWRRLGAWLIIADCWNRTAEAANDRAA